MTTGLQISIPQRLTFIRTIVVMSLLLSLLFTFRLWYRSHLFPSAAVFNISESGVLHLTLTSLSVICLLASLVFRWHRLLLAIALSGLVALVLLDLNRLQQWVFIYCSMLAVLVFYNGRVDDPNKFTSYFIMLQIMVCSHYFYSGFHQLQANFIPNELEPAISPLRGMLTERQFDFCLKAGHVVPYLVMFTAISLFIAPLRYIGITIALLMHLVLLLLRHPLRGGDLPGYLMNITMMAIVVLLFSGKTKQRYFSPSFLLQRPLFYIVTIVFVIMPLFNNRGGWPDVLSGNVYTGNRPRSTIIFPVPTYLNLPFTVKQYCSPVDGKIKLDHEAWCSHELGVPFTHAPATFGALLQQLEFWNRGPVKDLELLTVQKKKLLVMP